MKSYFTFIISFFSSLVIYGQEIVNINDKEDIIDLGQYIQYYEDNSRLIDIEQIKSDSFQQNFKKPSNQVLNFGNTSSVVWLKINFNIQSSQKHYLQIDNSYLDSLFIYYPDKMDKYSYLLTGKNFSIETESIPSTHSIMELPLFKSSQVQTIYLRLSSQHFLHIPIKLITNKKIVPSLFKRYAMELIYFGVILSAIFYNLFIYASIKDIAYLYYVLYTFLMGLNIFNNRGYLSLFFPEYRDFISQYTYLPSFLFPPLVVLFTIHFLKVKEYSRSMYIFLKVITFIFYLFIFLVFTNYGNWVFKIMFVFSPAVIISCLIIAFIIYKKGYKIALFYLLAWGICEFLSLYALLISFNFFEFYSYTKYLVPWAITLETIISSMALANRINVLRKENINLIRNQKDTLEEEVKRRTEELEGQKQEIENQNEELSQQREELVSINDNLEEKNEEIKLLNNHLEDKVSQRTIELKQTLDNLTKQNQDLSQFSFIVSHNLRSPVARILGLVELFNEKDNDEDTITDIMKYLKQSAIDLDTVIYDLSQIISIRNDLNKTKEQIDILEVIRLEQFLLQDEIKRSNVIINTDLVSIKRFLSIKSYFQSIIYNLLSNAIKYKSEKRSLIIHIKTEMISNFVCLSVQDNGLGIDLDNTNIYKIFGLYQRMHNHVEGKGLGLFLVKTQIESLGGKVELDSKLDVGSTFKVYFPT